MLLIVNYIASLVFFGKLTGSYAEYLFNQNYNKEVNLFMTMNDSTGCPLNITRTSLNTDTLRK